MQKLYPITIEKLVFGGQGLARFGDVGNKDFNNKTVFVWNALPGEEVEVEIIKKKKSYLEAIAVNIIKSSPERIEPKDTYFLSTSAWEILTPERENYWKKAIAAETYSKIGDLILSPDNLPIATDGIDYGYRNKMEFSFTSEYLEERQKKTTKEKQQMSPPPPDDPISLAFFKRGGKKRFPVTASSLASAEINETAEHILNWINKHHIPIRSLKSLIIRSADSPPSRGSWRGSLASKTTQEQHETSTPTSIDPSQPPLIGEEKNKTIAALFLKDKLPFDDYPTLTESMTGFQLYYSTHKSPASLPTELLYTAGQDYLTQDILGTTLKFGALSFFQINPPVFEMALKDIAAFLDPKKPLVDFYAGVGAISLPLAMNREETLLVESNEEAVEYAKENIQLNNITNASAHCLPAEDMLDAITADRQIVLDPPRAGLHESVVNRLLAVKPQKIIYLSCNLSTQARDMKMLSEQYKPIFMKLYNFFPRTPHVEGLVVLERISS